MSGKRKKKANGSRKVSPTEPAQDKADEPLDLMSLIAKLESKIKVIHGVNDDTFDGMVGKKVSVVREAVAEAFNLPPDALSFVNGERVDDDYILKTNDVLEFIKRTFGKPLATGPTSSDGERT